MKRLAFLLVAGMVLLGCKQRQAPAPAAMTSVLGRWTSDTVINGYPMMFVFNPDSTCYYTLAEGANERVRDKWAKRTRETYFLRNDTLYAVKKTAESLRGFVVDSQLVICFTDPVVRCVFKRRKV